MIIMYVKSYRASIQCYHLSAFKFASPLLLWNSVPTHQATNTPATRQHRLKLEFDSVLCKLRQKISPRQQLYIQQALFNKTNSDRVTVNLKKPCKLLSTPRLLLTKPSFQSAPLPSNTSSIATLFLSHCCCHDIPPKRSSYTTPYITSLHFN